MEWLDWVVNDKRKKNKLQNIMLEPVRKTHLYQKLELKLRTILTLANPYCYKFLDISDMFNIEKFNNKIETIIKSKVKPISISPKNQKYKNAIQKLALKKVMRSKRSFIHAKLFRNKLNKRYSNTVFGMKRFISKNNLFKKKEILVKTQPKLLLTRRIKFYSDEDFIKKVVKALKNNPLAFSDISKQKSFLKSSLKLYVPTIDKIFYDKNTSGDKMCRKYLKEYYDNIQLRKEKELIFTFGKALFDQYIKNKITKKKIHAIQSDFMNFLEKKKQNKSASRKLMYGNFYSKDSSSNKDSRYSSLLNSLPNISILKYNRNANQRFLFNKSKSKKIRFSINQSSKSNIEKSSWDSLNEDSDKESENNDIENSKKTELIKIEEKETPKQSTIDVNNKDKSKKIRGNSILKNTIISKAKEKKKLNVKINSQKKPITSSSKIKDTDKLSFFTTEINKVSLKSYKIKLKENVKNKKITREKAEKDKLTKIVDSVFKENSDKKNQILSERKEKKKNSDANKSRRFSKISTNSKNGSNNFRFTINNQLLNLKQRNSILNTSNSNSENTRLDFLNKINNSKLNIDNKTNSIAGIGFKSNSLNPETKTDHLLSAESNSFNSKKGYYKLNMIAVDEQKLSISELLEKRNNKISNTTDSNQNNTNINTKESLIAENQALLKTYSNRIPGVKFLLTKEETDNLRKNTLNNIKDTVEINNINSKESMFLITPKGKKTVSLQPLHKEENLKNFNTQEEFKYSFLKKVDSINSTKNKENISQEILFENELSNDKMESEGLLTHNSNSSNLVYTVEKVSISNLEITDKNKNKNYLSLNNNQSGLNSRISRNFNSENANSYNNNNQESTNKLDKETSEYAYLKDKNKKNYSINIIKKEDNTNQQNLIHISSKRSTIENNGISDKINFNTTKLILNKNKIIKHNNNKNTVITNSKANTDCLADLNTLATQKYTSNNETKTDNINFKTKSNFNTKNNSLKNTITDFHLKTNSISNYYRNSKNIKEREVEEKLENIHLMTNSIQELSHRTIPSLTDKDESKIFEDKRKSLLNSTFKNSFLNKRISKSIKNSSGMNSRKPTLIKNTNQHDFIERISEIEKTKQLLKKQIKKYKNIKQIYKKTDNIIVSDPLKERLETEVIFKKEFMRKKIETDGFIKRKFKGVEYSQSNFQSTNKNYSKMKKLLDLKQKNSYFEQGMEKQFSNTLDSEINLTSSNISKITNLTINAFNKASKLGKKFELFFNPPQYILKTETMIENSNKFTLDKKGIFGTKANKREICELRKKDQLKRLTSKDFKARGYNLGSILKPTVGEINYDFIDPWNKNF